MYKRGARFERDTANKLKAKGYTVVRSAASKSPIDLIASNGHHILFIQCKTSNNLKLRSILREKNVKALINFPLDDTLRRVVKCMIVAKDKATGHTYQLTWTGYNWTPVQII
jgi:Holliday junction resolvase